jgi:hypothetical protein
LSPTGQLHCRRTIVIQINSGILLSHDQQQELLHQAVVGFFDQKTAQLNHLLRAVSRGGIEPICPVIALLSPW